MGLDLDHWRPGACGPALGDAPRVTFYGNLGTKGNQEGALHLVRDLVPALRSRIPGVQMLLLGAAPSAGLRDAAN